MKNTILFVVPLVILAIACGTDKQPQVDTQAAQTPVESSPVETVSIYTVNYPLQYFAERIGGELVSVSFPAPEDVDPAYWAPDAEQIAAFQQADLILLNGLGYAKWLQRATLPAGKLVDTSTGYEDRRIPLTEGTVHSHGPEGEHSHKGYAFTSWLDPRLAQEQAKSIAAALIAARPESQTVFEANLADLIADLDDLDNRLATSAQAIGDQPILFSHPVYQYLEAAYELDGRSVHWEPDEPPSEEQWRELGAILADHPARWMIWEGEPLADVTARLRDLGVESVVFGPCANTPAAGDLLSQMRANAAALASPAALE